jgi:hypothetical protein
MGVRTPGPGNRKQVFASFGLDVAARRSISPSVDAKKLFPTDKDAEVYLRFSTNQSSENFFELHFIDPKLTHEIILLLLFPFKVVLFKKGL